MEGTAPPGVLDLFSHAWFGTGAAKDRGEDAATSRDAQTAAASRLRPRRPSLAVSTCSSTVMEEAHQDSEHALPSALAVTHVVHSEAAPFCELRHVAPAAASGPPQGSVAAPAAAGGSCCGCSAVASSLVDGSPRAAVSSAAWCSSEGAPSPAPTRCSSPGQPPEDAAGHSSDAAGAVAGSGGPLATLAQQEEGCADVVAVPLGRAALHAVCKQASFSAPTPPPQGESLARCSSPSAAGRGGPAGPAAAAGAPAADGAAPHCALSDVCRLPLARACAGGQQPGGCGGQPPAQASPRVPGWSRAFPQEPPPACSVQAWLRSPETPPAPKPFAGPGNDSGPAAATQPYGREQQQAASPVAQPRQAGAEAAQQPQPPATPPPPAPQTTDGPPRIEGFDLESPARQQAAAAAAPGGLTPLVSQVSGLAGPLRQGSGSSTSAAAFAAALLGNNAGGWPSAAAPAAAPAAAAVPAISSADDLAQFFAAAAAATAAPAGAAAAATARQQLPQQQQQVLPPPQQQHQQQRPDALVWRSRFALKWRRARHPNPIEVLDDSPDPLAFIAAHGAAAAAALACHATGPRRRCRRASEGDGPVAVSSAAAAAAAAGAPWSPALVPGDSLSAAGPSLPGACTAAAAAAMTPRLRRGMGSRSSLCGGLASGASSCVGSLPAGGCGIALPRVFSGGDMHQRLVAEAQRAAAALQQLEETERRAAAAAAAAAAAPCAAGAPGAGGAGAGGGHALAKRHGPWVGSLLPAVSLDYASVCNEAFVLVRVSEPQPAAGRTRLVLRAARAMPPAAVGTAAAAAGAAAGAAALGAAAAGGGAAAAAAVEAQLLAELESEVAAVAAAARLPARRPRAAAELTLIGRGTLLKAGTMRIKVAPRGGPCGGGAGSMSLAAALLQLSAPSGEWTIVQ